MRRWGCGCGRCCCLLGGGVLEQYWEAARSILLKAVCLVKLNFPLTLGRLSIISMQALYLKGVISRGSTLLHSTLQSSSFPIPITIITPLPLQNSKTFAIKIRSAGSSSFPPPLPKTDPIPIPLSYPRPIEGSARAFPSGPSSSSPFPCTVPSTSCLSPSRRKAHRTGAL